MESISNKRHNKLYNQAQYDENMVSKRTHKRWLKKQEIVKRTVIGTHIFDTNLRSCIVIKTRLTS